MRKIIAIVGVLVVVAGAAAYGIFIEPTRELRGSLDRSLADLPVGYSGSYREAHYDFLTHIATIDGLTIRATGAMPGEYAIGTIKLIGPNLSLQDGLNRAKKDPNAFQPDQALPVADRVEFSVITAKSGLINGSIKAVAVDKTRIYPWALLHPGLPGWNQIDKIYSDLMQAELKAAAEQKKIQEQLEKTDEALNTQVTTGGDDQQSSDTAAAPKDQPAQADADRTDHLDIDQATARLEEIQREQLKAIMPLARMEAALLLGVGIDGATLDGLDYTLQMPATGSLPAMNWRIAVQGMHEGSLDRGVLDTASMDGLVEDIGPIAKVSAKHAAEEHISFREPALRLLNGEELSLATLNGFAIGRMAIDELSVAAPNGKSNEIQNLFVSSIAFDQGMLSSATFGLSGAKITKDALPAPELSGMFEQFGLDTLTVNFSLAYHWDAEKGRAVLEGASLKVDELGALTVRMRFGGVRPDKKNGKGPVFGGGSIRYDDASLVNRMVGGGLKSDNQDMTKLREAALEQFLAGAALDENDKVAGPAIKSLKAFAKDPHSLTVTAKPQKPVPLDQMQMAAVGGLAGLIDLLGLTITANQ
jgi:hypothetical protein